MNELKFGNFVQDAVLASRVVRAGSDKTPMPTLVIGDLSLWKQLGHQLPKIDGFEFTDFEHTTLKTIHRFHPQIVLSPLTGRDFDAIDIARRLMSFGYMGRYRVVTDGVPAPDVVTKEVNAIAPELDFGVLQLPLELKT